MAFGDTGNPSRFLQGQAAGSTTADMRTLSLDIFGGEVLTAYDMALSIAPKIQNRTLRNAKSATFPKTWKATAAYHTAGQELLGNEIETGSIQITVDEILVAHTAIYDLDEVLTHFEVRSEFSRELGASLARVHDKNSARQLILAARTAAVGPFPGGTVITDAALTNTGVIDGKAWIDAIRTAQYNLFTKDVSDIQPRTMFVNWNVFDAIKYAKDSAGNYLVLNRDFNHSGAGGIENNAESIRIDGVTVFKTRNLPTTNEAADATVYSKYQANYSTTTGILFTPMAAATVKLMDVTLETTRDTRRLEDFMVAKSLAGHGTLRPECAVEFKTS